MNAPPRPRTVAPALIEELARRLGVRCDAGLAGGAVTGMSLASTTVQPGDLYAALPGANTHGARFTADAVRAGAVAVLTDADGRRIAEGCGVPILEVADPRAVTGSTAAWVYGDPASAMTLIGITGTQGKTTTTQLVYGALTAAGRRAAVVGTLGTRIADRTVGSALTTPEAPELHALLAVMREADVEICAMEVSSHALVMGRVDGVTFDVAAFTNFGRDHLDFHGTVQEYFAAKAALFQPRRAHRGLLNADDDAVAALAGQLTLPTSSYSMAGRPAVWRAVDAAVTANGSRFTVSAGGLRLPVRLRLAGDFNVSNALCALACVGEAGAGAAELRDMAAGLGELPAVSGRMESVDRGQDFQVYVDYAHKPDALAAMLASVRRLATGRVTVVLGAGGERDAGKRPLMGRVAADLADAVVVTDDNPRGEDPAEIRSAILSGAVSAGSDRRGATVQEIADRHEAIEAALSAARPGDTVVIAGKGHETGQLVGVERLPFDDRLVAEEVLDKLTAGRER